MPSLVLPHLLTSHLLTIVGFGLAVVLGIHLLSERRPAGSTLAWLLSIVLIPYIGVPLYLILGGRKLRQRAARKAQLYALAVSAAPPEGTIARMLCASGAPPPREGNQVDFLLTGEEAFEALLTLIDGAERTIEISTFILAGDETGTAVTEHLVRKAESGVQVRLLLDQLFQFRSDPRQLAALRRAGGQVAWFMPVLHVPFRGHANLRLHRKVAIADGSRAIVGGMNLAREYMGPTPLSGRWRDLSARVVGPAVSDIRAVFAADWRFAAGEVLADAPEPSPSGAACLQVVGSGPDVPSDLLYDAFLSAVFEAKRRLWIATPYFVPDEGLTRAIVLAARRGVDVRVLVPERSNHLTADLAGGTYLRQVAEAGGKVHCYRPEMMHAKVVLVDDALGALGSANLDMRSLFLNYEIGLFLSSRPEIDAVADWFESVLPACVPLAKAGRPRAIAEAVARLLGPLE